MINNVVAIIVEFAVLALALYATAIVAGLSGSWSLPNTATIVFFVLIDFVVASCVFMEMKDFIWGGL